MNLPRSIRSLSASQFTALKAHTDAVKARSELAVATNNRAMIRNAERAAKRWVRGHAKANGLERARSAKRAARKEKARALRQAREAGAAA